MPEAAKILAFRDLLRARFPGAHAAPPERHALETGIRCLDAAGLEAGTICEIVAGHASSGSALLLCALVEGEGQALRQPAALVDAADAFDPRSVSPDARERLLWLRCRGAEQALRAADLILRDGNMPRVLLDLQLCAARSVRQLPAQAWHRLRLLAEKSGAALCAFTPAALVPCARTRLVLEQPHPLDALEVPRANLLSGLDGRAVRRGLETAPGAKLGMAG